MCNTTPTTTTTSTTTKKQSETGVVVDGRRSSSSTTLSMQRHNGDSSERDLEDVEMNTALLVKKSSSSSPTAAEGGAARSKGMFQSCYAEASKNGKILSACAFYSFCSVSMVLTNKSLASRYVFNVLLLVLVVPLDRNFKLTFFSPLKMKVTII